MTHGTNRYCAVRVNRAVPGIVYRAGTSDGGGSGASLGASSAAGGNAGGPSMPGHKGPTDRTDVLIAIGAVVLVIGGILALALG